MNVLSNNCLGGFIYRDILHSEYKNPFIWTFIEINSFIDFVDKFKTINFNNVIIDKEGKEYKNNFITVIDDKYRFRNGHIIFSKKDKTPRIQPDRNTVLNHINVYFNKPWEYILIKYENRKNRMDNDIRIAYMANNGESIEELEMLASICEKHHYPCLIFSEYKLNNTWCQSYIINPKNEPWIDNLYLLYKTEIEEFVK